jgi:hypothetical protein
MSRVIAPLLVLTLTLAGCSKGQEFTETSVVATLGDAELTAGRLEAFLLQAPEAPTILQGQSLLSLWLDHAGMVMASGDPALLDGTATQEAAMAPELLRASIAALANQTRGNRPAPTTPQVDSLARLDQVRVFERFYIPLTDPNDTTSARRAGVRMRELRTALGTIPTEAFSLSRIPANMTSGVSRSRTSAMSRAEVPQEIAPELWRLEPGMVSDLLVGNGAVQLFVRVPDEDAEEQLGAWLKGRLDLRADSIFVDSIARAAGLSIPAASLPRVRNMAREPFAADGEGPLVTLADGGMVTVADLRSWLGVMPLAARAGLITASDSGATIFLTEMAKRSIMQRMAPALDEAVVAAATREYTAKVDSLRSNLATMAPSADATERVNNWMDELLAGRRRLVPLPGALGLVLRDHYRTTVNFEALEWVVQRAASAWAVKSGTET